MKLFEDFVRTDASPARFTESSFSFLNRASWPEVEAVRTLLEKWFSTYPVPMRQELKNRFTSLAYSEHLGAWWELYVYSLYQALGYSIEVHPDVPGTDSKRSPDFLVSNDRASFYVECTAVSPRSHSGEPSGSGQSWIYDAINEVDNPNFYVGLRILQAGTQQPRSSSVRRQLTQWLARLEPDASDEIPPFLMEVKDWKLDVTAYRIPRENRTGTGRLLGILPPSGAFFVNDVEVIHDALRDKGGRYGERLDKPLIVAIASVSGFTDEEHVTDAVFGRKTLRITEGQDRSVHLVRMSNGYWRPATDDSPPRGARVSGVLFGQRLAPYSVATAFPKLWLNPWAFRALTATEPFTTVARHDNGEIIEVPGTGGALVLGLASSWPN